MAPLVSVNKGCVEIKAGVKKQTNAIQRSISLKFIDTQQAQEIHVLMCT